MFWFVMYVNESIENIHSEWVRFQGRISWRFSFSKNNISPRAPDLELLLFPLWCWPVMNTHTKQQQDMNIHTKQQDKVFEMDFIDSQKSDSSFVHLLTLSHISEFTSMQKTIKLKKKKCVDTEYAWEYYETENKSVLTLNTHEKNVSSLDLIFILLPDPVVDKNWVCRDHLLQFTFRKVYSNFLWAANLLTVPFLLFLDELSFCYFPLLTV